MKEDSDIDEEKYRDKIRDVIRETDDPHEIVTQVYDIAIPRKDNSDGDDNNMTNPQKRVIEPHVSNGDDTGQSNNRRLIEQRSKGGYDHIEVQKLLGETVFEHCSVCRRSLPDTEDRSELFHITATTKNMVNDDGVNTKSFCEHCAPPHAIDVEVMVKSSGSTPRDAYIYYEIDTVFMHDSEAEQLQ